MIPDYKTFPNRNRWYVTKDFTPIKGSGGRVRWFRTQERAERYAAALNRGCKRPAGHR